MDSQRIDITIWEKLQYLFIARNGIRPSEGMADEGKITGGMKIKELRNWSSGMIFEVDSKITQVSWREQLLG